jgi:uncharacterized protein (DUF2141 family)
MFKTKVIMAFKGLILLILCAWSLKVNAQAKVVAEVINFENNKGVCRACIFNNAASFNGEGGEPLKCVQVPVKNKTAVISFEGLQQGTYAIFLFHDVNSNNKMDKNFLGIPKEGYGASKNKLPFANAPNFNENKFTLENGTSLQLKIRLRNL